MIVFFFVLCGHFFVLLWLQTFAAPVALDRRGGAGSSAGTRCLSHSSTALNRDSRRNFFSGTKWKAKFWATESDYITPRPQGFLLGVECGRCATPSRPTSDRAKFGFHFLPWVMWFQASSFRWWVRSVLGFTLVSVSIFNMGVRKKKRWWPKRPLTPRGVDNREHDTWWREGGGNRDHEPCIRRSFASVEIASQNFSLFRAAFFFSLSSVSVAFLIRSVASASLLGARRLLTTSIICIKVSPKLSCSGSDSLTTGRSSTL